MKTFKNTIFFILPVILLFIFNTTVFAGKTVTSKSFEPKVDFGTGFGPSAIATGQFNAGTDLDLAVVNYDAGTVSIFLGNAIGTFTLSSSPDSGGIGPYSIVAEDLDGDGDIDLAIANANSIDNTAVTILLNDGNGVFTAGTPVNFVTLPTVPYSITACDFDGDTNTDLVVANLDSDNVSILLGDGTGAFTEYVPAVPSDPISPITITKGAQPASVATGDFDGDGKAEVVIANYGLNSVSLISDVNLTTTYEYTTGQAFAVGINPISITTGDFNGDGDMDIVTANINGGNISLLLGYGDNTFTPAINYYAGLFPSSVTADDFNGDGNTDLVVTNIDNQTISVLYGNGNGSFQYPVTFPTGVYPISSAAGNFNGGGVDLAVANFTSDTISIFLNNDLPKVKVTGPNGLSVHLMSGTSYDVTWEADLASESFDILLSTDNGRKFKRIAKGLLKAVYETAPDSGKYIYPWTVPIPKKGAMRNCLIKVIGYDTNKDIVDWDTSDSTFSIDIVKVTAPNGGETYTGGNLPFTVNWTTYGTKNDPVSVGLSYSTDNGRTWTEYNNLAWTSGSASSTDFVPDASSSECLIKVDLQDSKGNSMGYDISDNVFTINPALTVGYPNAGGITLTSGTALTVTWDTDTSMTVSNTVITYSTDNGSTWNPLATIAGHPSPDTWTGTVPVVTVSSPESLIRVELLDALAVVRGSDISDNVFTIDPP